MTTASGRHCAPAFPRLDDCDILLHQVGCRLSCTIHVSPWLQLIKCHCRDWFNPAPTALQLVTCELLVERQLRKQVEERLAAALKAQWTAERQRDQLRASAQLQ